MAKKDGTPKGPREDVATKTTLPRVNARIDRTEKMLAKMYDVREKLKADAVLKAKELLREAGVEATVNEAAV